MKHSMEDTIAAIATPLGVGGVGVIRVSGERARDVLAHIFFSSNGAKLESHRMLHGWLVDPLTKEKIDEAMSCLMLSPKSYTGEDVVEFYCHGSMAVVQRVLDLALGAGARLAQKGEFTKRAFLNKKIDLAQAEAVLALVQAQTIKGAGFAVKQLEGKLSSVVSGEREKLIQALAGLEALIDFPDDLPELDYNALIGKLGGHIQEIEKLEGSACAGRIYREGLATVIVGKPNVGKSSLLNALLDEQRAIVTDVPGTTRDAIEEGLNIGGLPLKIIDTAGIRHPKDRAEEFGVERTEKELEAAEFALIVLDASGPLDELDEMVLGKIGDKKGVLVLNKVDLGERVGAKELKTLAGEVPTYRTSALKGQGIQELAKGIFDCVKTQFNLPVAGAVAINARHKECLLRAKEGLGRALDSCEKKLPVDFITIDIKEAIVALGEISGELVSEEVINTIFEQFCVGK